jgi:hypothetical protein
MFQAGVGAISLRTWPLGPETPAHLRQVLQIGFASVEKAAVRRAISLSSPSRHI